MIRYKELGSDLLSHAKSILSLALVRFTALFEMGRGGSKPLWPPSITGMSGFRYQGHVSVKTNTQTAALKH